MSAPKVNMDAPLQMLVANIDYDEFKGRIAIGRIHAGEVKKAQEVKLLKPGEEGRNGKVAEIFTYENFVRTSIDSAQAG